MVIDDDNEAFVCLSAYLIYSSSFDVRNKSFEAGIIAILILQ